MVWPHQPSHAVPNQMELTKSVTVSANVTELQAFVDYCVKKGKLPYYCGEYWDGSRRM
jgi:hypothetical protein